MLRLSEKPLEWAKFTLVIAVLLVVASWYISHAFSLPSLYPILSSVFMLGIVVVAFINPTPFKPLYSKGMKLSYSIGQVISRVMLVLFFLIILTPIALILRLLGKEVLSLRFRSGKESYWRESKPDHDFDRMF